MTDMQGEIQNSGAEIPALIEGNYQVSSGSFCRFLEVSLHTLLLLRPTTSSLPFSGRESAIFLVLCR